MVLKYFDMFFKPKILIIFLLLFGSFYYLAFAQTNWLYNFVCNSDCQARDKSLRAADEAARAANANRRGYPMSESEQVLNQGEFEKNFAKDFADNVKPGGENPAANKAYDFPADDENMNWKCNEKGEGCKFSPARVAKGAIDKFTRQPENIELSRGQKRIQAGDKTVDTVFNQVAESLRTKTVKRNPDKKKGGLIAVKKKGGWATITTKAEEPVTPAR